MNKTTAPEGAIKQVSSYSELSALQKQRYAHLKGIYEDETAILRLVQLIEARGQNSWKAVTDKIDALNRADYRIQMYDDTLYENFIIEQLYSSDEIIKAVGEVRRDLMLPTYLSSLKKNCEADFFKLFIIDTVVSDVCCAEEGPDKGKTKRVTVGHIPLIRLKPVEQD